MIDYILFLFIGFLFSITLNITFISIILVILANKEK